MKEIDLLADYIDYKTADGCLNWNGFKSVKQRPEIEKDFDVYVESKSKKSSLDETLEKFFKRLDRQIESMESGLSCIEEDVDYLSGLINDIKNELGEIKVLRNKRG